MKLYNSLTRQKEDFIPLTPGHVTLYVCGPTVYDYLHIGNARPMVVFDTFARHLITAGLKVQFVQNFTDIDDKIISRAVSENTTPMAIASTFMAEAKKDMAALNITMPTKTPTVTEDLPEIIQLIQTLIDKGHAYESRGNVYFNTPSYPAYGALKPLQSDTETRIGEDSDKKHPTDFVLWKAKKDHEPLGFESPWGLGRPGWHIECSAMIEKHLGKTIDIHGGGFDLLFPHHENEIAQSCCAHGTPKLANFFMHNQFINIDNAKMAKSAGNFLTIREVGKAYGYDTLRFFLLSTHYRNPLNFSDEALLSAKNGLKRIKDTIQNLAFLKTTQQPHITYGLQDGVSLSKIQAFVEVLRQALNDDFNTAMAIGHIFEFVTLTNAMIPHGIAINLADFLQKALIQSLSLLGISLALENQSFPQELKNLKEQYEQARTNKDFATADALRDTIKDKFNVVAEVTRQGIRWKQND